MECSVFTWRVHRIHWTGRRNFAFFLGINIFVLPDIDYFVVFTLWLLHGHRERSKRSNRKRKLTYFETWMGYKPSKLGNFAGGTTIDVCSCSCAIDPMCIIYINVWYRKIWNYKQFQTTNSSRSSSIGYQIKREIFKIHFGIKFLLPICSICHFMSRGTFASPRTKTITKVRWKMKFEDCGKNLFETGKKLS